MESKRFFGLLALVVLTALLAATLARHGAWPWAILSVAACVASAWKLYGFYTRHTRRIRYLLDAIQNDDFAIRFPVNHGLSQATDDVITATDSSRTDDDTVNRMLNRIIQTLSAIKTDAEQREKYYERILDVADTGLLVIDETDHVMQTNRAVMHLLGMDVLTHLHQLEPLAPELADALRNALPGQQRQVTVTLPMAERQLSMHVSGITLRGQSLRIVALSDIRRELDDREIDTWVRLTRVLTHEIMNGLTPVTSLSQTLLTLPGANDPSIRQGLQAIHSTGEGLLRFVASYRRLTRLPQPHPTLFNVRPFLERQIRLAQEAAPSLRFTLLDTPADLIAYADEGLMAQVVSNLILNAVQAIQAESEDRGADSENSPSAASGQIRLRAYCADDESIHIEVANDGPEIPAQVAEQIFVPFFTTKDEGSGIGLSLSKQIMRMSGGTLSLLPYAATRPFTVFEMVLG
jgi:nitrogen fixation/metabolism regulation signal transduction histidine kinase